MLAYHLRGVPYSLDQEESRLDSDNWGCLSYSYAYGLCRWSISYNGWHVWSGGFGC